VDKLPKKIAGTALLVFVRKEVNNLTRTEAYEDVRNATGDLMNACRGMAKKLSLKQAGTKVIDTMT
jgi:hypothetical protein